jgi:acyl carrier protein
MPMEKIYGADSLQALQLAVNVEPTLIRIGKKYDLYFPTGEGYFEN